jgi:tagatose 1,6-diphosphate aldolase GatY/KbaY
VSLFRDVLARDRVAAVTCYSAEMAEVVLQAAEDRGDPVVLMVSEQAFELRSGPRLMAALVGMAAATRVPALVQVDHVRRLDTVARALEAGAQVVMADGSSLDLEANVRFTTEVVTLARRHGAGVEAELGQIPGDEEDSGHGQMESSIPATDPHEAQEFVSRTGVDCLAVAIGNLHGTYVAPPRLDWDRLRTITSLTDLPLALHGASGLARSDLVRALGHGVRKVNFNTEFRTAWFAAMLEALPSRQRGARQLELLDAVRRSLGPVADEKIELVSGSHD